MSLELCILGSGSTGNATMLRAKTGTILIDAGLGPRTCAKRMQNTGSTLADVRAIVLTHLDSDHFSRGWVGFAGKHGVKVFVYHTKVRRLIEMTSDSPQSREFAPNITPFTEHFEPLPGVVFSPIECSHDEDGSHGYHVECRSTRVGFATDLGRVPRGMVERFTGVDILAIESNYDPYMQAVSGRPLFLQHRITGGRGHLSNEQALVAVRAMFDRCAQLGRNLPAHVVLLHRSQDCNCPKLLHKLFSADVRIAPRLTLAEPHTPTPWLSAVDRKPLAGEQLSLAWG